VRRPLDLFKETGYILNGSSQRFAAATRGAKAPLNLLGKAMSKQRVIAYIDGFNLFYSSLKGTGYKWLDIASLCESMLMPDQELVSVKYFSALVGSSSSRVIKKPRDWYCVSPFH
jgi:hypothetical protein